MDMEFVQFEPTIVVHPAGCRGMEMPTAMLGDGAPGGVCATIAPASREAATVYCKKYQNSLAGGR
ncbi:MAG: hypothetical protein HYV93_14110 [Candidatus Rokubacteria bacterium]|nr:hypothetical protein [Candidatus Rokubacteria bacterium]